LLPRLYSMLPILFGGNLAFPPLHAYFEVTYRCNLRCDMCHFLEIIEDTENNRTYKNELTADQIKQAITKLPRFTVITFTGGEALMKSDFMEILEFAASRNKVHIITNGTLLSDSMVEKLMSLRMKSLFGSGLFYVGVSLEGNEKLHDKITTVEGSCRNTRKGLERLVKKREAMRATYPLIHLTCVMNRANVMDLVPLYEYANEIGVNVSNFVLNNTATYWHGKDYNLEASLHRPPEKVEEIDPDVLRVELDRLIERSERFKTQIRFSPNYITPEEIVRYYSNQSSYKNYRCYVAWAKVAVSAYGDVFSCPLYRKGSLPDNGGAFPWNVENYKTFRAMVKKEGIFPGCLGCCQSEYIGSEK